MSLKMTGLSDVVDKGLCTFCGACLASCPRRVLVPLDESPFLAAYKYTRRYWCFSCDVCYHQCPLTGFSINEAEMSAFGRYREKSEELGVHRGYYIAYSLMRDILDVAQDGGVVTSILAYLLKSGKADAAITSQVREDLPWKPWPLIATTYDEVLKSAGSKYTPSPQLYALVDIDRYKKSNVILVGLPCHMWGVRKMQFSPHRVSDFKIADIVKLTVGLFCMEAYNYDKLLNYVHQQGIDPMTISRFDIKEGRFIVHVKEKEAINIPVRKLKMLVKKCCHHCIDYAAELADLSVGGVGCQSGTSIVIPRSKEGEEAFKGAIKEGFIKANRISESDFAVSENMKLSAFKRKRAKIPYIP